MRRRVLFNKEQPKLDVVPKTLWADVNIYGIFSVTSNKDWIIT